MIASTSSSLRRIILALVHGGSPVRLALVPMSNPPHPRMSFKVTSFLGHLIAIVLLCTPKEREKSFPDFNTNVSGPGQNLVARTLAVAFIVAMRVAILSEETRIGNGFSRSPLTESSFLTAPGFRGSQPSP